MKPNKVSDRIGESESQLRELTSSSEISGTVGKVHGSPFGVKDDVIPGKPDHPGQEKH